jgi:hypothetical protein
MTFTVVWALKVLVITSGNPSHNNMKMNNGIFFSFINTFLLIYLTISRLCIHTVLITAPYIPAGMTRIRWNPLESTGMRLESAGMRLE